MCFLIKGWSVNETSVVDVFNRGGIIAYPTEAVFGLGCDPDNEESLKRLLQLKQRPAVKGLILLAGSYSQLLPYIDDSKIPQDKRFTVLSRWPDGITQLMPKNNKLSPLLSGISGSLGFTSLLLLPFPDDVVLLAVFLALPLVLSFFLLSELAHRFLRMGFLFNILFFIIF